MQSILGLDIGGANTKACLLNLNKGKVVESKDYSKYHEVWKNSQGLSEILEELKNLFFMDKEKANEGNLTSKKGIALTMTAELCDTFLSKTEGVLSIIEMTEQIFGDIPLYIWTTQGSFASPAQIRKAPLQAAAANWLASAAALSRSPKLGSGSFLLIDMGSTTTDIIPIIRGKVMARGRTDTERLATGELVYSGLLRTAVNCLTDHIYIDGIQTRVVNEYFAISADVYRLLELISEADYDVPTPDGGGKDPESCARRLARAVASDLEELGMEKVQRIARYFQEKQINIITEGILQNISRKDLSSLYTFVTTGQGTFILQEVARRLSCSTISWWEIVPGAKSQQVMTAYCAAWLLVGDLAIRD
ncbi:MAG: hypothetical protein APF84_01415 [Gracilibacter sp. BRH_c7a]|nr:MAG: hypothetical protein APF84_01415 [Gracilibacter sp. BRH_c7a]